MVIKVKRVYEKSAKADGTRLLVDRLWPRGVSKEEAAITDWAKDFTPSDKLRKWFHVDQEGRFKEFKQSYSSELKSNKAAIKDRLGNYGKTITLVTSVKDVEHSHIPTLKAFLEKLAS